MVDPALREILPLQDGHCDLCLNAIIPVFEPNVSPLIGVAPHPTALVKPGFDGEFFCVTAGRQVGIVSSQSVFLLNVNLVPT